MFAHRYGAECGSTGAVPVWSEDGFCYQLAAGRGDWRERLGEEMKSERERARQSCLCWCSGGIKEASQLHFERLVTSGCTTWMVMRLLV